MLVLNIPKASVVDKDCNFNSLGFFLKKIVSNVGLHKFFTDMIAPSKHLTIIDQFGVWGWRRQISICKIIYFEFLLLSILRMNILEVIKQRFLCYANIVNI